MQRESSLNRLKLSKERQREVETPGALFVRRPHRSKDPVNSAIFSVGLNGETVTAPTRRRVRRTGPELTQSVRGTEDHLTLCQCGEKGKHLCSVAQEEKQLLDLPTSQRMGPSE